MLSIASFRILLIASSVKLSALDNSNVISSLVKLSVICNAKPSDPIMGFGFKKSLYVVIIVNLPL